MSRSTKPASTMLFHADWRGDALHKAPENVLTGLLPVDRTKRVEIPIVVKPVRAGGVASALGPFLANVGLKKGGEIEQCGWLRDRWGLSWQIAPKRLGELMSDPDRDKAKRVAEAMPKMVKLDIAELEAAARG